MKRIALITGMGIAYKQFRGLQLAHFQNTAAATRSLTTALKRRSWEMQTDLQEQKCTRAAIQWQLEQNAQTAKNLAASGQTVELLFYYRGHADRTYGFGTGESAATGNLNDEYLVTWSPAALLDSHIADHEARKWFFTDDALTQPIKAALPYVERYFVILDCCYSGGLIDEAHLADPKLVVLAASNEHTKAWGEQGGVTFFTSALSNALQFYPKTLSDLKQHTTSQLRSNYHAASQPHFRIHPQLLNTPSI